MGKQRTTFLITKKTYKDKVRGTNDIYYTSNA